MDGGQGEGEKGRICTQTHTKHAQTHPVSFGSLEIPD